VPPRATGYIDPHPWSDGKTVSWRLQVRANGRRRTVTLGTNHEGWSEERAQVELDNILAEIRRGTWRPDVPVAPPAEEVGEETLHVTASRWWKKKQAEIEESTASDYQWRLSLLLKDRERRETPIGEIDEQWVDELRDWLARQPARNRRPESGATLSPRSVNMVLDALAQILDLAQDYKLVVGNAARGKRRRMRVPTPSRFWLEPDMVVDLLDAAGEWEQELIARRRPSQCYGRRELLALLCLGGPRISEAVKADRGEFDLAGGDHWRIPAAKTDAGARVVDLTAFLAEELRGHVAASPARGRQISPRKPMWPTVNATRLGEGNVRRMLREVVERTNERRGEADKTLLPEVTPHTLRRTFASLCFLAGRDPAWVMGQIGHTDARLTLEVYAKTMQRKRVDRDLVWRLMRFADEPEKWSAGARTGTTISTTVSP